MTRFTATQLREMADSIDPDHRNVYGPASMLRQAADDVEGWLAMTCEARRMKFRHVDLKEGDIYHAMQSLVARYGSKVNEWVGEPIDAHLDAARNPTKEG